MFYLSKTLCKSNFFVKIIKHNYALIIYRSDLMFNEEKMNNKVANFIEQIKGNGAYADVNELKEALGDFTSILKTSKDCTPGEIAQKLLGDVTNEINNLIKLRYADPGIFVGFDLPMFNASINAGYTKDIKGEPITSSTLFDLASITKIYTAVIAYKLIDEGLLIPNQKVAEILKGKIVSPEDLDGITVKDIMQFGVEFRTPGRIDDAKSTAEAMDILYNVKVVKKNIYNYNDIGMMLLKEVMEEVTSKTYEQLFNDYIVNPLLLKNTMLTVPESKRKIVTGTPNWQSGLANDPKAIITGGHNAHAGVFANNFELIQVLTNLWVNPNYFDPKHLKDLTTPGLKDSRGIYGSTYTTHPTGLDASFVDKKYPRETFAVQGSTRTQAITGIFRLSRESIPFGTTILMNPDSLSKNAAIQKQDIINRKRSEEGKNPINIIKEGKFIDEMGQERTFSSIDGRPLIPVAKLDELNKKSASAILKLALLGIVVNEYEPDYNKNEDFTINPADNSVKK